MNNKLVKKLMLKLIDSGSFDKNEQLPRFIEVQSERQGNNYDCGTYVMMNISAIIDNIKNG